MIKGYKCDTEKLFKKYFLYFFDSEWYNITHKEEGILKTIREDVVSQILRQHWWDWTVLNHNSLEKMDEKYPDEVYFCGASLGVLYKANQIIGDDMIFSPKELAEQL